MAQNVEDLRVRRTRQSLQKALLAATIEKGFADVTVRDIVERAMVNRSTFYRHYRDKYELLNEYIQELYARAPSSEREPVAMDSPGHVPHRPPSWLVGLLRHVEMNADFYRVMLGPKGDPAFCAQSFRQYIEKQFYHMVSGTRQADPSRPPLGLSVSYVAHAQIGVMAWWLENGQRHAPEQLALWLHQLTMADLRLSLGPRTLDRSNGN